MENMDISELAITIVEPSPTQGRIIEGHLKGLGVTSIEYYQTGQEALESMCMAMPDLVVSSMHLPDMTGTELVETMRGEPQLEAVPFMLVSSETSFASLDQIRQAGVVAILPKPFDPADLKMALHSTLEFINPDELEMTDINLDDLHVLVVDDSMLARNHIKRVLNNLGIQNIEIAENGKLAAEKIENDFFDLIVTDYNMPEMDGEELTRYIREQSSQSSIPVLMVTSEENDSRLSAVQQAGVSGICDKPFEPHTVKQLIRNILSAN